MIAYRVFLSYRGKSDGKQFCSDLYDALTSHPGYRKKYGEIYFSPISEPTSNYKLDIPRYMKKVEQFVMPLTQNFWDDFWDDKHNCPNVDSITFLEIEAAIKVGAHFICVSFPNYEIPKDLLWRMFKDNEVVFRCAKRITYDADKKLQVFEEIKKELTYPHYSQRVRDMPELLSNVQPNIFLTTKGETEDKDKYPFYERLHGVKRIYMLNFAGTSFINSAATAAIYEDSNWLRQWFFESLQLGKIQADVILTDPHSTAAIDAANYKMFPEGPKTPKDRIISDNLNELFALKHNFPQIRLNVFLTRIALPYGIMLLEYDDRKKNHMKVDLYPAVIDEDRERPSFYLLESNTETHYLYNFFKRNMQRIRSHYAVQFSGHPTFGWLFNKPIIHRGVLREGLLPHTERAYRECIQAHYPMEVDLLLLRDSNIILVGRDDQNIAQYGINKKLSECSANDLHIINQKCGEDRILTLEELLELVNGRIPLLVEIKTEDRKASGETIQYIEDILRILQSYLTRFASQNDNGVGAFAIHSANPYVVREIKMRDCLIPCGVISTDFSRIKEDVGEEFYKMHLNADFVKIANPDFISYDVKYLKNGIARRVCREQHIPLLAWTIKNAAEQIEAEDGYHCNNIIIEGSKSYRSI